MTPAEAEKAVRDGMTVRLLNAHNRSQYAIGRAISYSLVPTITIELSPTGPMISWRHDLAEAVKPEEPTGLGAVVEDVAGNRWVQFDSRTGNWWRDHRGQNRRWADIDAVRVLSEGVQP